MTVTVAMLIPPASDYRAHLSAWVPAWLFERVFERTHVRFVAWGADIGNTRVEQMFDFLCQDG
ncbi:MAG: hypothetical protein EBU85_03975 [Actinobacteria bacterium]|nr:hypothetical protein [Actinomycetota bacterium]